MRLSTSILGILPVVGVLVVLGTPRTAASQPGTVATERKLSSTLGMAGIDNLDEFGGTVCDLGDLDGPGPSVNAIAVGAVNDDDGGGDRGAVYILFLDAAGAILSQAKISDTAGNFTAVIDNVDAFGSAVAFLGDLDGPGPSVGALAVGVAGDDDGGTDRGAVYIIFLNSAGACLSFQKISDTVGNFTAILDNADEFGASLVGLGDLDGAGPSAAALAVGVAGDDDGGINFGAVYILFLNSAGSTLSHQKISKTSGGFTAVLEVADEFGSSVAHLGDLDGPGPSAAALAVGAIGDDDGGSDRGAVYILFLSSAGGLLSYQKISDTAGGFTAPLVNLDELGGAVADLGDLDQPWGPSVRAMAVGAIGDDDGGAAGSSRGATYIMFLNAAGSVVSYQKISDTAGGFNGVLDNGDEFGGALAGIGTLSNVGSNVRRTLAVGVSFDDDGGADRGAVYLLNLKALAVSDAPALPVARGHVLGNARPNPFNPTTTIPFLLRADGWVEIGVYDLAGRLVRTLTPGMSVQGEHEVVWDAIDSSGRSLASGTYFYRMSVDGQVVGGSRKAILLK